MTGSDPIGLSFLRRESTLRLTAFLSAGVLALGVCLPWYRLPVAGWHLPAPAWNQVGLLRLVTVFLLLGRALGWSSLRWGVRLTLPFGWFGWWTAEQSFRTWGATYIAPLQLRLAEVNSLLAKFNMSGVDLYEPALWRQLEPSWGWGLVGLGLLLISVQTLGDRSAVQICPGCRFKAPLGNCFCACCGHRFRPFLGCTRCAKVPLPNDRFCRACGTPAADDEVKQSP